MSPRADFTFATKTLVAKRAGYRCSFPDCDRSTIGPGAGAEETASTGVGAHIFSASAGGPRGPGGLTDEELVRPENCIWLCGNHARLVDTNRGAKYPPALLLSFKALHEARIARDMQGLPFPFGWFHEVRVPLSPIFSPHVTVQLGKLNLLVGNNGSGKSALCEWIGGFSQLELLDRWRNRRQNTSPVEISLKLFQPDEVELGLTIDGMGDVSFTENGAPVPINVNPARIVYPRARGLTNTNGLDDRQLLAHLLRVDECQVGSICQAAHSYEHSTVKNYRFAADEENKCRLSVDVSGTHPGLSFRMLSGTEQEMVFIELVTALARAHARHAPTLLVLDAAVTEFFDGWFEFYANHLNDANSLFQTIVVIPTCNLDTDRLAWLGWEIIRTTGKYPEISIEQSIRRNSEAVGTSVGG